MNASQAFRSHLMQQFVATAKSQGRTPIALAGWIPDTLNSSTSNAAQAAKVADEEEQQQHHHHQHQQHQQQQRSTSSSNNISSIGSTTAASSNNYHGYFYHSNNNPLGGSSRRHFSTGRSSEQSLISKKENIQFYRSNSSVSSSSSCLSFSTSTPNDNDHDGDEEDDDEDHYHKDDDDQEEEEEDHDDDDLEDHDREHDERFDQSELAKAFHDLMMTRRTTSKFGKIPTPFLTSKCPVVDAKVQAEAAASTTTTELKYYREFWNEALERAVIAGCSAPNHKKTEPFTFKRIIGPSETTERLADIAYHVNIWKQQQKMKKKKKDEKDVHAKAQSKRDRWSQIPAFLVTIVNSSKSVKKSKKEKKNETVLETTTAVDSVQQTTPDSSSSSSSSSYYTPLPYRPPTTERELEDYAAACAAVQNCLLSLHSEHLVTKWASGPVVETPAFRELIQAQPDDRVVALIMIGGEQEAAGGGDEKKRHRRRRMKRSLQGDLLVDL